MGYTKISSERLRGYLSFLLGFPLLIGALFYASLGSQQTAYAGSAQPDARQVIKNPKQQLNPEPLHTTAPEPLPKPTIPPKPTPDALIPPIQDGLAPIISHLPTSQPVVFVGIDDGVTKLPENAELLHKNNIVASLFLEQAVIMENPNYFLEFIKNGSFVENHTVNHPDMAKLGYEQQKLEICSAADAYTQIYGRRPVFFRPPYGSYNVTTQRAAADCGMKAVVMWHAKAAGGAMQYQDNQHLMPGDIVLMHFRPEFPQDLQAFINAMNASGLHTEKLTDWLPAE